MAGPAPDIMTQGKVRPRGVRGAPPHALTRSAFARLIGRSRNTVREWERQRWRPFRPAGYAHNGRRLFPYYTRQQIAEAHRHMVGRVGCWRPKVVLTNE